MKLCMDLIFKFIMKYNMKQFWYYNVDSSLITEFTKSSYKLYNFYMHIVTNNA